MPRVDSTGVVITLEFLPQVNLAHDQRVPTAQPAQAGTMAEHRQNLLDGVMGMRTKLLDF